ncbi:MAG TPA: hypothetical protein DEP53_17815 [Bacteroidetes bacterium]|nr:hypothetical protein [Bacteroidota bacterium]
MEFQAVYTVYKLYIQYINESQAKSWKTQPGFFEGGFVGGTMALPRPVTKGPGLECDTEVNSVP